MELVGDDLGHRDLTLLRTAEDDAPAHALHPHLGSRKDAMTCEFAEQLAALAADQENQTP